jgi:hypothetical protein
MADREQRVQVVDDLLRRGSARSTRALPAAGEQGERGNRSQDGMPDPDHVLIIVSPTGGRYEKR